MMNKSDFMMPPNSPVLYYLQRLRDEAHRFAIGSHRARRSADIRKNPLDGIDGIGASRKRALLHHFGSGRAVGRASLSELEKLKELVQKWRNAYTTTSTAMNLEGTDAAFAQYFDAFAYFDDTRRVSGLFRAGLWGDLLALLVFSIAGFTDFFDGWLARKLDVQSGFGACLTRLPISSWLPHVCSCWSAMTLSPIIT